MESVIGRLHLRALPPFSFNAGLALFAVAGDLLLPKWLGGLAGSLLAMQALVTLSFFFLLLLLVLRHAARAKQRQMPATESDLRLWSWVFDCLAAFFLSSSLVVGGIFGPLEFIVLAGTAYIGAGRDRHDARAFAELGAGFAVSGVVLLLVAVLFRLPEQWDRWAGAPRSVGAAGCYFGMMAAAEAAGAFPRIAKWLLAIGASASAGGSEPSPTPLDHSKTRASRANR
jgi:hypothetical protein